VESGAQLLQGVSEENDKGVIELVESQYYKQECNHHQGEDSLPAQHDNSLQETGTLLQNRAGKLFTVKLFKLEEEEFVLTIIDSTLRTRNAHAPACYRIDALCGDDNANCHIPTTGSSGCWWIVTWCGGAQEDHV
jgi:hypothetical protein